MKRIPLTKNKFALIDDEDFALINKYKWCFAKVGYAVSRIDNKITYMHKLIINDESEIDHGDGNKLNNQRCNLRKCSRQSNVRNTTKRKGDYTSLFKGVHFDKRRKKWKAEITINYKNIYIGRYSSEQEARNAYLKMASIHFGEFIHNQEKLTNI